MSGVLFQSSYSKYCLKNTTYVNFALLPNSSDLHIYKDLYGERNKPEKNDKLPLNYNKNHLPEVQRPFLCVLYDFFFRAV